MQFTSMTEVVEKLKSVKVSISGARGLSPEYLDESVVFALVSAFLQVVPSGSKKVAVAWDSRSGGKKLYESALAAVENGGFGFTALGVVPLPTLQVYVEKNQLDAGIHITASHNPAEYNGVKFLNQKGEFINNQTVQSMMRILPKIQLPKDAVVPHYSEQTTEAEYLHLDLLLKRYASLTPIDRNAKELVVAVDAVHAAGSVLSKALLESLGCGVIPLANDPDQPFPHTPEPKPENIAWTLNRLKDLPHAYDVCFVLDPDADRLLLVDENGACVSEEALLPLIVKNTLESSSANEEWPVVVNQSTSQMTQEICNNHGAQLILSMVGEANVVRIMKETNAQIGGEGSGGIIDPSVHYGRDAFVAMVHVVSLLQKVKQPLSKLTSSLPKFYFRKVNIRTESAIHLNDILQELVGKLHPARVQLSDGIRLSWPRQGTFLHIRKSNTEPLLRVYCESKQLDTIESYIKITQEIINT